MDFPPLKDPNESETFSNAWAEMSSMYSAGKYCKSPDNCKTLGDLEHIMGNTRTRYALPLTKMTSNEPKLYGIIRSLGWLENS